ncbi:hypothetical protein [Mesorhizobium sp. B1-1-5]|uniref:hypothetical protein n=1 Tax=Mesorhizobium sp. B1-1-5 TaxID=2589979 RepID=UPI001AEE4ABD|nr:hypothetical protein [Mesorhizobium sp. B1-1-5]
MSLQHSKGRGLGAARGLAYIAHVVDMDVVDELAEGLKARNAGLGRRLSAIYLALGFGR